MCSATSVPGCVAPAGTLRLSNCNGDRRIPARPDADQAERARSAGGGASRRNAALPAWPAGSARSICCRRSRCELFGARAARVGAGAGDLRVGEQKVTFSYPHARPTRTALDVFTERIGVCRDFQHLAITFCRCLNIPARYATGYLGDIGVPLAPVADGFQRVVRGLSGGRWWTFDARHNVPRIGRVLIATGLDATDVAITTSFGSARLSHFEVVTDEIG